MRRVGWIIGMLLVLAALAPSGVASVRAQHPDGCDNKYGKDFQEDVYARYEVYNNRRLVLFNGFTGKVVQVLEVGLDSTTNYGWSPDCRYVTASVGPKSSSDTVIWDVTTNRRVGVFKDARKVPHRIRWNPGEESRYVLVETRNGAFLWDVLPDRKTQLTEQICPPWYWPTWDLTNQQILVIGGVQVPHPCHSVSAYHLPSGQRVGLFDSYPSRLPVGFCLSDDKTRLILWDEAFSRISVWNRGTGHGVQVSAGLPYASLMLSPDGRFLLAGERYVRVWDLTDLPAKVEDRLPRYRFAVPEGYYYGRFINTHVLEYFHHETDKLWRFDLSTKQPVSVR